MSIIYVIIKTLTLPGAMLHSFFEHMSCRASKVLVDDASFIDEMCISAEKLISERNCRLILIPFHFSEDMAVIEKIEKYLAERNLSQYVCTLKNKYLTVLC